jgi:D-alanine-D-alanine ligase
VAAGEAGRRLVPLHDDPAQGVRRGHHPQDPHRGRHVPAFYDFDAKYLDDVCEFDVPAKLDDDVAEDLREMAVAAFRALDGQGLARVDFFVGPDAAITVNEVNTMPGFTPISMYPRAWAVTGVDYPTLLTTLVETAVARGTGLR